MSVTKQLTGPIDFAKMCTVVTALFSPLYCRLSSGSTSEVEAEPTVM